MPQKTRLNHEDGPRGGRAFIGFRLRASAIAWLDEIADATGKTRTDVVRACLALGRSRKADLKRLLTEDVDV